MSWKFSWFVLGLYLSSSAHSFDRLASDSLDAFLQDFAFKALARHRPLTGALYKAVLPANLSGMEVSIVRIRSRRLWNVGSNFTNFCIPSRTIPVPHVKRVAIVYQNMGNWSFQYYSVPGYSFISSVVGFMVFDASIERAKSIRKISLKMIGMPVSITFKNETFPGGMIPGTKCVAFSANGTVQLSEVSLSNICYYRDQGHFSLVVPLRRKQKQWYLWVIGFVLGFGGLVLAAYTSKVLFRVLKTKKIQVMERQADEGEVFSSRWVGSSKMPSATVTRTQPVLEN
ncbi:DUF1191 domain-containing protein [Cephalotus follicularis]|uniref:DUF1191 domain-containing protein n=1 Tax=Cephalotus follicularis TaxID=3775 RepID=A0A1Q3B6W0_CEPFO|nr:DUF1191 domain-containing protein [Cephalotus follicularis]